MRQMAEKEKDNDRGNKGAGRRKSKQVVLASLYSLQTQNRSPFPTELMKTTNNERLNQYQDLNIHNDWTKCDGDEQNCSLTSKDRGMDYLSSSVPVSSRQSI